MMEDKDSGASAAAESPTREGARPEEEIYLSDETMISRAPLWRQRGEFACKCRRK